MAAVSTPTSISTILDCRVLLQCTIDFTYLAIRLGSYASYTRCTTETSVQRAFDALVARPMRRRAMKGCCCQPTILVIVFRCLCSKNRVLMAARICSGVATFVSKPKAQAQRLDNLRQVALDANSQRCPFSRIHLCEFRRRFLSAQLTEVRRTAERKQKPWKLHKNRSTLSKLDAHHGGFYSPQAMAAASELPSVTPV